MQKFLYLCRKLPKSKRATKILKKSVNIKKCILLSIKSKCDNVLRQPTWAKSHQICLKTNKNKISLNQLTEF